MTSEHLMREITLLKNKKNSTVNDFSLLLELAVRSINHLEQKLEALETILKIYKEKTE